MTSTRRHYQAQRTKTHAARKQRLQSFLPSFEALESRWVPTTVTNLDDAGAGSLRQAILDTPSGGIVDFQPGLSGNIVLTGGELVINSDLLIAGPGANVISVSGNNASRVLKVATTATATVSGLAAINGRLVGESSGGGIHNSGTLTLSGVAIINNRLSAGSSQGAVGGGLFNAGTLVLLNSTVSNNSASAIATCGPPPCPPPPTARGGGVYSTGAMTVRNSTISGNSVIGNGFIMVGGIFSTGTLTITSSTISANSGNQAGGLSGSAVLSNTIIAGNSPTSIPDVAGTLTSYGYNLIGNGAGSSGFNTTDWVGTAQQPLNPSLGPLQDNGGPTPTHALLPGSWARNRGAPTLEPVTFDQRGPGFPRVVNGRIDIGAVEAQNKLNAEPVYDLSVPLVGRSQQPLDSFMIDQPRVLYEVPAKRELAYHAAVPRVELATTIRVPATTSPSLAQELDRIFADDWLAV